MFSIPRSLERGRAVTICARRPAMPLRSLSLIYYLTLIAALPLRFELILGTRSRQITIVIEFRVVGDCCAGSSRTTAITSCPVGLPDVSVASHGRRRCPSDGKASASLEVGTDDALITVAAMRCNAWTPWPVQRTNRLRQSVGRSLQRWKAVWPARHQMCRRPVEVHRCRRLSIARPPGTRFRGDLPVRILDGLSTPTRKALRAAKRAPTPRSTPAVRTRHRSRVLCSW